MRLEIRLIFFNNFKKAPAAGPLLGKLLKRRAVSDGPLRGGFTAPKKYQIINKLSSKKHKVIHHMNDTNIIIIPELILLFNQFLLMNIENQLKIMIRINCISVFDQSFYINSELISL